MNNLSDAFQRLDDEGEAPMAEASAILISLSSFGAAEVRRLGQPWFAHLAAQAGADGIEVRGELMTGGADELASIADALPGLQRVYSSHESLWAGDGKLDRAALDRGLAAARDLGAPRLKMSIGHWRPCAESMAALRDRLDGAPVELMIENDQTASAGTLDALAAFFDAAQAQNLPLGMTFDIGNWHWTGECPLRAAAACAPLVRYVHCKGVQRERQRWVAVPLADSAAPWRAMPGGLPWAIEYPLTGDDLRAVARREVEQLRTIAGGAE